MLRPTLFGLGLDATGRKRAPVNGRFCQQDLDFFVVTIFAQIGLLENFKAQLQATATKDHKSIDNTAEAPLGLSQKFVVKVVVFDVFVAICTSVIHVLCWLLMVFCDGVSCSWYHLGDQFVDGKSLQVAPIVTWDAKATSASD